MSQSNDIFDLLSGPPSPAVQQPLQSLQFNMAAPASSSGGTFSPNYHIDLSLDSSSSSQLSSLGGLQSSTANQTTSLGQMGQQTNPSMMSPSSQQNGSPFGQLAPQQSSSSLFSSQQPFGQMTTGQNSELQSSSLFGDMPGSQNTQQSTSLFGEMPNAQSSQQPSSLFGQGTQQPAFGQSAPNASLFGQTAQQTSQFGQNAQFPSQLGQNTQGTSPFGQNTQLTSQLGQSTSLFGQSAQSTSPFGQSAQPTSLFGQNAQPASQFGQAAQPTSPFGQTAQPTSQFGQSAQPNSPFGQTAQPTSPFGQTAQPTSPFDQNSQQPTSPFGQMGGAQGTQQPMSQFAAFPNAPGNAAQSGMSNFPMGGAFNPMSNTSNPAAQQAGSDPFAIFSNPSLSGSASNINTATTVTTTSTNNDDFFAAFSSSTTTLTKPAPTISMQKSASSSALDDSFLNAFSQSSTIANTPASLSSSNLLADPVASDFDPFGLMASEKPAQPQAQQIQQQQAPVEPMFDAFSSEHVPRQATPEILDNDEDDEGEEPDTAEEQTQEPTSPTVTSAADDVTAKTEISDPVLREINDKYGGRWKLVRSDPYDEFLKSVGIGLVHRKRAGKAHPEQSISVKPDGDIHVTLRSTLHSQAYLFKLNEERENLVEKMPQSVFCSYSNGKLFLQMTPPGDTFGRTQEVERFINEKKEMVQIHSSGAVSCRRYFAKLDGTLQKGAPLVVADTKAEESSPAKTTTTTTPTIQAPPQKTPSTQEVPPRSPKIQQKSLVLAAPPPSKPTKSAPMAVVDLSQSVATLGVPSSTKPTSPPAAANPALTPGQLLLQNLQDEGPGNQDNNNIFADDNQDKLVFTTGDEMTAESEA